MYTLVFTYLYIHAFLSEWTRVPWEIIMQDRNSFTLASLQGSSEHLLVSKDNFSVRPSDIVVVLILMLKNLQKT